MSITIRKSKRGEEKYFAQVCVNGIRPSKTFNTLSEAIGWEEETKAPLRGEEKIASNKERAIKTLVALQQIFDCLSKIERKVDCIVHSLAQSSKGAGYDNH